MSRRLAKVLMRYQNEEEAAIMRLGHDMDESGKELLRELYTPTKITNEDLSRIYTPVEIRHLCLRTKIRVNMTLFNCVWDAKQRLDKKGRLANRSQRFVDAMLIKSVTKKMVFPYTSKEIATCNYIRQCKLKKENNRRLNVWHFECSQASIPEYIEKDNIPEVAAMVITFPTSIPTDIPPPSLGIKPEILPITDFKSESTENDFIESVSQQEGLPATFAIETESVNLDSEYNGQNCINSEGINGDQPASRTERLSSTSTVTLEHIFKDIIDANRSLIEG